MQKPIAIFLSIAIAICILLVPVGSAHAGGAIPISQPPSPTFTPLSGDVKHFSFTIVPLDQLPGITTLTNGMLVPVGFPAGEKQFSSSGIQLNAPAGSTGSACFPFLPSGGAWAGKVAKWTGSKWQFLPTNITSPAESEYSLACSTLNTGGTYALIVWVGDPAKLSSGKPNCGYPIKAAFEAEVHPIDSGTGYISKSFGLFIIDFSSNAVDYSGIPVIVTVSSTPEGMYTWTPASISGNLAYDGSGSPTDYYYYLTFSPVRIYYMQYSDLTNYYYHFDFGSCVQDVLSEPS